MAPTSQQVVPDNHNDTTSLQTTHQDSLVTKVYATLLANKAIQTGLKQISLISQPILTKVDYKLVKLAHQLKRLISRDNIYNHLANLWLSHALPNTGIAPSLESFTQEYNLIFKKGKKTLNTPKTVGIFHQFASEAWTTLSQPSNEDVKSTILKAVARTVNKAYGFTDETLSDALDTVFKAIIEKRGELVSSERFVKLVKAELGDEFVNRNFQTIGTPCEQFYVFARRFVVLDFPLSTGNKDVVKLVRNFIQDSSFFVGDSALDFVEKKIDFISEFVGQDNGEFAEDSTISEKARRVLKKAVKLSAYPLKRLEDTFHQVQGTKYYAYLDSRIQFNKRIDNAIFLSAMGYNMLRENILKPSINTFQLVQNKTKAQVTVIVHNLDVQSIRKNYAQLHAKYEVLQKCAVIIAGETVKLVFDKKALAELGDKGKKELFRVYHELKTLETQKIVELSLEYYAAILKKAKSTYSIASKAIDSQKKEEVKPVENSNASDSEVKPVVVREEQPVSNSEVKPVEVREEEPVNNTEVREEKPADNSEVKAEEVREEEKSADNTEAVETKEEEQPADNSEPVEEEKPADNNEAETVEVREEEQSEEKPVENGENDSPSTNVGENTEKEANGSSEEENH